MIQGRSGSYIRVQSRVIPYNLRFYTPAGKRWNDEGPGPISRVFNNPETLQQRSEAPLLATGPSQQPMKDDVKS